MTNPFATGAETGAPDAWLAAFHEGRRSTLEACYRDHHAVATAAVAKVLEGADRETVVHEVFYRLLTRRELRENFRGGNFAAWLSRVATNQAIDHRRRYRREAPLEAATVDAAAQAEAHGQAAGEADERAAAKRLVERFREEVLPPKWHALFDARFLRQLDQYAAARELGIARSTLVYQEQRVRELLRAFVLGEGSGK